MILKWYQNVSAAFPLRTLQCHALYRETILSHFMEKMCYPDTSEQTAWVSLLFLNLTIMGNIIPCMKAFLYGISQKWISLEAIISCTMFEKGEVGACIQQKHPSVHEDNMEKKDKNSS